MLGSHQVPTTQSLTNTRATDAILIFHHGRHMLSGKSLACAHCLQQREVSMSPVAKPEIIANHQKAHPKPSDQQLVDEVLSGHLCQLPPKPKAEHSIDPSSRQCLQFAAQSRQAGWRRLRSEIFERLWLEHDHCRRQATSLRFLAQSRQDSLMTSMHTIKVADGCHTTTML